MQVHESKCKVSSNINNSSKQPQDTQQTPFQDAQQGVIASDSYSDFSEAETDIIVTHIDSLIEQLQKTYIECKIKKFQNMKQLDSILKILLNKYLLVKNINGRFDYTLQKRTLSGLKEVLHNYPTQSFKIEYLKRIWKTLFNLFVSNAIVQMQQAIQETLKQFQELIFIYILFDSSQKKHEALEKEVLLRQMLEQLSDFIRGREEGLAQDGMKKLNKEVQNKEDKNIFAWIYLLEIQDKISKGQQKVYFNLCQVFVKEQILLVYGQLDSIQQFKNKPKDQDYLRFKYQSIRVKLIEVYFNYLDQKMQDNSLVQKVLRSYLIDYEIKKTKQFLKVFSAKQNEASKTKVIKNEAKKNEQVIRHCLNLFKFLNSLLSSKSLTFLIFIFSDFIAINAPNTDNLLKTLLDETVLLHYLLNPFIDGMEFPLLVSSISQSQQQLLTSQKQKSTKDYQFREVFMFFKKGQAIQLTEYERQEVKLVRLFYQISLFFQQFSAVDMNSILVEYKEQFSQNSQDLIQSFNLALKTLQYSCSSSRHHQFKSDSMQGISSSILKEFKGNYDMFKDDKVVNALKQEFSAQSIYENIHLFYEEVEQDLNNYIQKYFISMHFFYLLNVLQKDQFQHIDSLISIKFNDLLNLKNQSRNLLLEKSLAEISCNLSVPPSSNPLKFFASFVLLCKYSFHAPQIYLIQVLNSVVRYNDEFRTILNSQFYSSFLEQYQIISESIYETLSISKEDSLHEALWKYLSEDDSRDMDQSPQIKKKGKPNQVDGVIECLPCPGSISSQLNSGQLAIYFHKYDILEFFFQAIFGLTNSNGELYEFETELLEQIVYKQNPSTSEEFDLFIVIIHMLLEIQIRTKNNVKLIYSDREQPFPKIMKYFQELSEVAQVIYIKKGNPNEKVLESFRKDKPTTIAVPEVKQGPKIDELDDRLAHYQNISLIRESKDRIPSLLLFLKYKQVLIQISSGTPYTLKDQFNLLLDQLKERFSTTPFHGFQIYLQDLVFCFVNLEQSQVMISPQKVNNLIQCWEQAEKLFKVFNVSIKTHFYHKDEELLKLQKIVLHMLTQIIRNLDSVKQVEQLNVLSVVFLMLIDFIKNNKSIKNEELLPLFINYYQKMESNPNIQGETKRQYFLFCLQTLGDNLHHFNTSFFAYHVYQMTILKTPSDKFSKEAEVLLFQSVFDSVKQYTSYLRGPTIGWSEYEYVTPFYSLTSRLIKTRVASLSSIRGNINHVWLLFLGLSVQYRVGSLGLTVNSFETQVEPVFKEILDLMVKQKVLDRNKNVGKGMFYSKLVQINQKEKESQFLWNKSAKIVGESCSDLIKYFT